jgi:hypothetical protein
MMTIISFSLDYCKRELQRIGVYCVAVGAVSQMSHFRMALNNQERVGVHTYTRLE